MDSDYTGKHVSVTTTTGAKYKGILQKLNISNGTITINNISQLQPPYTVYPPAQMLSFAGNDLTELSFIDDEDEREAEAEEVEKDEIMQQQEQFQKELEAMRSKSKKENQGTSKEKSSFFDSFDDEEEYGKNKYNYKNARKTNFDTFGESGMSNRKGKNQKKYYSRPSTEKKEDALKKPMF